MATYRIILGIFCLFITFGNRLFDSNLLENPHVQNLSTYMDRLEIIEIAQSQIGIREVGGNNKGKEVEAYLSYTNLPKGNPWCAAFVSWIYGRAGFSNPKTAWSPALFPHYRITKNPKPADVFGLYFSSLKRIAHCGIVEKMKGD